MSTQVPGSSYPTPYPGNSAGVGTFYPYPPYPSGVAPEVLSTLLDGLVSYWPLNEQSGVRYDAVGDNDLTDNNTVGAVNRGPVGTVASFVNTNSESLSAAAPALGDTDWTVAGWIYRDGLNVDSLASRGNAAPQCILRGDAGTENLTLFTRSAADSVTKSGGFTAGAWHFIVGWHDSVNNLIGVSLDGGTAVTAATGGANSITSDPLLIGGWDGHNYHSGKIGPVSIHSRVLTAEERTSLFNSGNGKRYADLTTAEKVGLVSYWNLDETSGARADSHGSNDLTDNNTVGSVINAGAALDGAAASFVNANSESLTLGSAIFTAGEPRSLSVWFKDANDAAANPILTAASTLGNGDRLFDIYTQGSSPNRYVALYGNGGVVSNNTVGLFSYGEWHHLLYTYDGATTHTFYLDGVSRMVESGADGGGADTFAISRSAAGYYNGQLDEVAIWSRVLTEDERTELYNAGAGKFYPFTA